jgi:lipopolysaccharide transport system permease protein
VESFVHRKYTALSSDNTLTDFPADKSSPLFEAAQPPKTTAPTSEKLPSLQTFELPEEPLVIERTRAWQALKLRDLWASRELLYFLTWRDVKVRYKQTLLGMAWVVLQPLLMTLIFTIFLGRVVQVPSDGVPYLLFAYAGLMLWTFFSGAASTTGNCLVGNAPLITKVYFPRLIIPIAAISARVLDLCISFIILIGLMFYYQIGMTKSLFMVPLFLVLLVLLALGFGLWTSAVNVKYRDVGIALPVLIQLWMFVSPILYPLSLVPPRWRLLYSMNPLVGIIAGFRAALFGHAFDWVTIGLSAVITLVFLVYAAYAFRNRERTFADII